MKMNIIKTTSYMNKGIFIAILITLGISSCNIDPCFTKSFFIQQYEKTTEEVFDNYKDYSDKDWEKKDEKMDVFVGQCYEQNEEKMTDEEKKDFWINYFKYKYYRHGRKVLSAIEADAKEFSIEIDEELEDLFDNPEEDVKKILNELYGDDINKAIDDFVKGINDIADKLKEWLDEE